MSMEGEGYWGKPNRHNLDEWKIFTLTYWHESKIKASQASNSLALIIYLRRSYNYFYFHFYMTIPRG